MLTLPEPERELWERFVSRGRVLASHPVLTRWKRALSLGVAADVVAKPSGLDGVRLRERRERCDALLEEGLPIVDPMASELDAHGLLAVVTDEEGIILASRGGGAFVGRAEAARLVEGARWDEPERGTNAIGTAIAEAVPVCVVGRAHFERANHGLVCYATPVHDAAGRLVGVLNVSGPVEAHNPYAKLAVLASGRAIERALRARAFGEAVPGGIDVLTRLADRASTPTYVTGARGELFIETRARVRSGGPRASTPSSSSSRALPKRVRARSTSGAGSWPTPSRPSPATARGSVRLCTWSPHKAARPRDRPGQRHRPSTRS